jgi:hypothetical protein
MVLSDGRVTTRQRHELVVVTEEGELADRALCQRRTELRVHHRDEAVPRQRSVVELEAMVPQLHVVQ